MVCLSVRCRGVLDDRSGVTGQEVWPGYQGWGEVGDERVAAPDKYQVRGASIYQVGGQALPQYWRGGVGGRQESLPLTVHPSFRKLSEITVISWRQLSPWQ